MYDIIANAKLEAEAKRLGITPLLVGKEVTLVATTQDRNHASTLLVLATSSSRELIEGPIDGVVDIERIERKDHLHYRRGGLDQVSARILATQNKALLVSFSSIKKSENPAMALGRVLQNIRIAKKAKAPILFCTFAETTQELLTTHDLHAFFRGMGVDAGVLSQAQTEFSSWIERARLRASDNYVAEGVRRTKHI